MHFATLGESCPQCGGSDGLRPPGEEGRQLEKQVVNVDEDDDKEGDMDVDRGWSTIRAAWDQRSRTRPAGKKVCLLPIVRSFLSFY